MTSRSVHTFNLDNAEPQAVCVGGNRTIVDRDNFPLLKGMALYLLRLDKEGIREPHWHPNAEELSYCVRGKAIMTIFGPDASRDTFTIDRGEIVFVPRGYLHHIENIGTEVAKFVLAFSHEKPEDLGISGSIGSMPSPILDLTFSQSSSFFSQFNRDSPNDILIGSKQDFQFKKLTRGEVIRRIQNRHKFDLEGIPPQIQTSGGTVSLGNANVFPILRGLACYSLSLRPGGIREPHWHPNAAELDYVVEGRAKMTILSPGGNVDSLEVRAGEIVFIPPAYLHYIENADAENVTHFVIFFGHERPEDIGISGALSAYSNEVLAGIFGTNPQIFESLTRHDEDVFVVSGGA
ncbi:MAG: cupin domain-containing protein [Nitrososphaeraceae archaeon]